ncbi:MAG: biotin/lipoyl-binding protein, partial [Clostridiales bacterium]|nr:biotin/lipoyl-binding protein [Clostridiales bacterium]
MKKLVRWIIIGLIVIAAGAYGISAALAPLEVKVTVISPKEANVFFTESGAVVSGSDLQIFPGVSGDVQAVRVKVGQTVRAGDTLLEIDPQA